MKIIFWLGILGLILFEIANVYFIMPIPGSQQMDSIDLAYFLYRGRWFFRGLFLAMIVIGLFRSQWKRKWLLIIPVIILLIVVYMANFQMAADHMFYQPNKVLMVNEARNKVDSGRLVIGVKIHDEAKAYPIRFLGYHHQVQDTLGGEPIMVTYCTVCRTGRVFQPIVNGKYEKFRLVGMDHFNAMFEDVTTKSWWRQVTGEAITGKLKGQHLPEVYSTQTSLAKWLQLNPNSLIMQGDSAFIKSYDSTGRFEAGKSKSRLTGTDSLSWKDKSWVIGVKIGTAKKVYDWNKLKSERIIQDKIENTPVLIVLSSDDKSFFAFERPNENATFSLNNDIIGCNNHHFRIDGKGIDTSSSLKPLQASQEFWHSWRTFYPDSKKDN
ncbi:MAG TPA: DUF3179 domain-containing (seleno)protein [Chitinophagaceae bacterium]|jgi:uncharacterized protein DUF3179|nr:DUF3179 domain-containing (seleno)protein [Chitinophagaceae bacterium]